MSAHLELSNVTFSYDQQISPLFKNLSLHLSRGWTGIVGANGSGKTTLLKLFCGELQPQIGTITRISPGYYCAQRTDDPPGDFAKFLKSDDSTAARLIGRLGILHEWLYRWESLSHGERKRSQIAVALWKGSDILAVDEPTNHVDIGCLEMLYDALSRHEGIGLLVSHNRELLDRLCRRCIFLKPPEVHLYRGGYSAALRQYERKVLSAKKKYKNIKREVKRLKAESHRRRREASTADKKRSKRGLDKKDHDAKAKKDIARLTGKDGKAGRLHSQLKGRLSQKIQELKDIKVTKQYRLGVSYRGEKKKGGSLFASKALSLSLGANKSLTTPPLEIKPDDRISVVGNNGCGKTTLVEHIINTHKLPDKRVVYLPQEIPVATEKRLMQELMSYPHERLGEVMTIVSRLGSRPKRLFESELLSPGEMRKALLAVGLLHQPWLIVMDEPTNHLDLPSIEVLEEALDEVECALLLVSHDRVFLNRLTQISWKINPTGEQDQETMQLYVSLDQNRH